MTEPPKMPLAPGGSHAGRVLVKMSYTLETRSQVIASLKLKSQRTKPTGPKTPSSVTSSVFSIGALSWSRSGGRSSVVLGSEGIAMVADV